jgi:hypothetical protein
MMPLDDKFCHFVETTVIWRSQVTRDWIAWCWNHLKLNPPPPPLKTLFLNVIIPVLYKINILNFILYFFKSLKHSLDLVTLVYSRTHTTLTGKARIVVQVTHVTIFNSFAHLYAILNIFCYFFLCLWRILKTSSLVIFYPLDDIHVAIFCFKEI